MRASAGRRPGLSRPAPAGASRRRHAGYRRLRQGSARSARLSSASARTGSAEIESRAASAVIVRAALRPQSVVEIPAQSTTLVFASSDEPLTRALQFLRETDRLLAETDSMHRNGRLMRQVLKQPTLSRPERLLTSARTQHEPAQCFATVEKRQSYRVRHRLADARRGQCGLTLDEFDGGIGQLQPLLQRKNHCG